MPHSLHPHGLQNTRLLCPSQSLWACSNSCPLTRWCHPTISSSSLPFSSCLQSFPASGSFLLSRLFGHHSTGVSASASVLPMNIQCWFPLELTGLIFLLFKELSKVFSSTTIWNSSTFSLLYGSTLTSIDDYWSQANMVDEAKFHSPICSTSEALVEQCMVRHCCGEELGLFCWSMLVAGIAVFSASHQFTEPTSQL